MNDLTRPSAILGYANTVGLAVAAVYLANKTSALNVKYNDLADDVDTIRDGIKEKVPVIENSIKGLDQNLRNIANAVNTNLGGLNKKNAKNEKKMNKHRAVIEEMSETIELLEARYAALVKALNDNKILENFSVDDVAPAPAPVVKHKKVVKKKRSLDISSSESESSSDSESEEEKPKKKSKSKSKGRKNRHTEDDDESDTNIVARMASKRN
jgi:hypothetical protein